MSGQGVSRVRRMIVSAGSARQLWAVVAMVGMTVLVAGPVSAAPGMLDPTFGENGRVIVAPGTHAEGAAAGIQSDGGIVVAGRTTASRGAIARVTSAGVTDPAFGHSGDTGVPFQVSSLAILPDDRIVVAGPDFGFEKVNVALYSRDGRLDRTFGRDRRGRVTIRVGRKSGAGPAMAIDSLGRIVVAAGRGVRGTRYRNPRTEVVVLRLLADGTIDRSFGQRGRLTVRAMEVPTEVAVDASGRVVVLGVDRVGGVGLSRLTSKGRLDRSFGQGGYRRTPLVGGCSVGYGMAFDRNGRLVVTGEASASGQCGRTGFVARYTVRGSLDRRFGRNGVRLVSFPGGFSGRSIVVQGDRIVALGEIASAGLRPAFGIVGLTNVGTLDGLFGSGGRARTSFGQRSADSPAQLLADSSGRLIATGTAEMRFAVARYRGSSG